MSDERFARQYRFGLPSGFPLTSSCTSIVHHLSGPNLYALARLFTKDQVQPEMRRKRVSPLDFSTHFGFTTLILAHKLDSLVRVSRRVGSIHITLFLKTHSPITLCNTANSTSGDPEKTAPHRTIGKNPSRCLTPEAPYQGLHSHGTKSELPSSTFFYGT